MKSGQSLLGGVAATAFGLIVAVGGAELAARIIMPHWSEYASERFMQPAEQAGFGPVMVGVPDFDGWFAQNNGDFRVPIHLDPLGLRNPDDARPEGAVWALGDSFTFGWGVRREEIFAAAAAAGLGLPFYSVASPGTDLCGYMALLARQPQPLRPRAVLLGLTVENDLKEYPSCGPAPLAAPAPPQADPPGRWRAVVKEWLLAHSAFYNLLATTLKRSPMVLELLQSAGIVARELHVAVHQAAHHDQSVLDGTAAAVARLRAMLPQETPFAVVLIPARFDLLEEQSAWAADREALVAALKRRDLIVVDPSGPLRQTGEAKAHFAHDGHWSALGHRIAGEAAAAALRPMLTQDASR